MFNTNVVLDYCEKRGTWNVYNGGEWYFESEDYEKANKVYESFFWNDDEEEWEV